VFVCPACGEPRTKLVEKCPNDGRAAVRKEDWESAKDDPNLGRTIAGRFTILARIGTGSMGTVYRADQASVGRAVALKILKGDLSRDPEIVTRFEREAKATGTLRSPHSVVVHDHGRTEEGQLFIAMELLEGELLTSAIAREGAFSVERTVSLLTQILRSLSEAHGHGIVHRDLKPDNVFLAKVAGSEVVKIVDFGIAKIVHGDRKVDALETQAGTVWGTPAYMSPEQAQSRPLDARSDLYAAGVIAYQMLTGAPPFEDDDAVVVMARHIKTKPKPPSEARPELAIPASLERVVMRVLEKDPDARPASADAFIAELQACASDVTAAREGRAPNAYLQRRRRRALALTAIAVSLLAAATVLATALGGEDSVAEVAAQSAAPVPFETGPATSAPASAAPSGDPSDVVIHVESDPSGADVYLDGQVVATTPADVSLPRGSAPVDLILRRRGRLPAIEHVVPSAPRTIHAVLSPLRPPTFPREGDHGETAAPATAAPPPTKAPYQRFD
jgi:serine/threonine-protein kinase